MQQIRNQIVPGNRPQGGAISDFDDRGKKFTTFINGNAIKNLLTQSLGGPQQAAQLTSTLIAVVQGNPKLQMAPPMEILAGALRGEIGMGLSMILGDYSIIPYENKRSGTVTANFQLQVNGIKRMCIASGAYDKINCYEVREGEFKGYDQDTWEPIVVRNPDDEEREKLPIVGYYAFYRLSKSYNGFTNKVYWPYGKILRHADRYSKAFSLNIWNAIQSGAKSGKDEWGNTWYADKKRDGSPWYGDPTDEAHMKMCRKTVLKQLLSDGFAPKSTIIQQAISADTAAEQSDEPITYADQFDAMAREAALAAQMEAPRIEAAPDSIPAHPEQKPAEAASRASEGYAQPAPVQPAEPSAPQKRTRTAKKAEHPAPVQPTPPAPAPAPEQPDFPDMSGEPQFGPDDDDDPFGEPNW